MANPTIGATTPRIQYTATSSQTVFTVPFEFLANADLAVYVNGTLKTLTTDYTLTGANTTGGGSLTFVTGRTAGDIVTILGNLAYSRNTNKYTKFGLLPAEVLEADFDALQVQAKQLALADQFAIRAPLTDTGSPAMTLPVVATRASKALGFDASGNPTMSASSLADIDSTVQIIDALNALPAGSSSSISYQPAETGVITTTVQAKLRETVSIKDYGAVGDGTTDDTAAFTAAYNATNNTGRCLFLPKGVYKITSPILCSGEIFGESRRYHGATIYPVGCSVFDTSANVSFNPANRTKFRNIRIDCSALGATVPAFKLWDTYSVELDGIYFDFFSGTQDLLSMKRSFDVLVNKCVIGHQTASGGNGVYIEDATVTMTNNDIEGFSSGVKTAGGSHAGGSGNYNTLVTILGNYFEANGNHINCTHGKYASVSVISPNIRIVNAQNGVRVFAPNVTVVSPNVEIDGSGGYAINVDGVKTQGGAFFNVNLIGCDESKILDTYNLATHSPSGNGLGAATGTSSIRRNQVSKQLTLADNVATTGISFYVPNASWCQGTLKLSLYKQSTGYTEYREYNVTINGTSGSMNYDFSSNKSVTVNNSQGCTLTISGANSTNDFIVTVTCDLAGIFAGTTIPLVMTFDYQCTGPVAVY